MKKLFSLILSLLILLPLTTGVFAAETAYVTDEIGRVESDTLTKLNEDAANLKKEYGIGVFLAYVKGHADDADVSALVGEEKDYVLLLLGERGTRILTGGKADAIFAESEDRDRLGYVHDEQDEWSDGIARYLEVVEEYFEDAFPKEETGSTETVGAADPEEEIKIDEGGKESKGFSPAYLIPILAAVIAAGLAVIVVLRKKKA